MKKAYVRIMSLLLAAAALTLLPACRKPGVKSEYTADEGLLVYHIYLAAYSFTESEYAEHNYIDKEGVSLKDMEYDDTRSWYDVLIERAVESLTELLIYCNAAAEEGITLNLSEVNDIENDLADRRYEAAVKGYDLNGYLEYLYDNSYVTEEVIRRQYELQYLSYKYSEVLNERFVRALTDRMVEDKLAGTDGERDETPTRNVGAILLQNALYESAEAAGEAAAGLIEDLKNIPGLDIESFGQYAADNTGGRHYSFENVAEGDLIAIMNEWLYSVPRAPGEIGAVSDEEAVYVIYYASKGDPVYIANAKAAVVGDMYGEWYESGREKYDTGITKKMIKGLRLDF